MWFIGSSPWRHDPARMSSVCSTIICGARSFARKLERRTFEVRVSIIAGSTHQLRSQKEEYWDETNQDRYRECSSRVCLARGACRLKFGWCCASCNDRRHDAWAPKLDGFARREGSPPQLASSPLASPPLSHGAPMLAQLLGPSQVPLGPALLPWLVTVCMTQRAISCLHGPRGAPGHRSGALFSCFPVMRPTARSDIS